MKHSRHLGPESDIEYIGPIDPDIALTADYLAKEATPEQVAEFERRFVYDHPFAAKIAPIIKIWMMPVSFRDLLARPPMPMPTPHQAAPEREQLAVHAAQTAELSAARRAARRRVRAWRTTKTVAGVFNVAAAAMTLIAMLFVYRNWFRSDRVKALVEFREQYNAFQAPAPGAAASIVPGAGAGLVPTTKPRKDSTPSAAEPRMMIAPQARDPNDTTNLPPGTKLNATVLMRTSLAVLGKSFRSSDTASLLVEIDGGTRVLLRPRSLLRSRVLQTPNIIMPTLWLDGEAAIEVGGSPTVLFVVHTTAGTASLRPNGSYALRCDSGCAGLQVSVASGRADLQNMLDPLTSISIGAGQFGVTHLVAPPKEAPRTEARSFPVPNPAIRKLP